MSSGMLHSIYDLTTFCRKTTGDVPAKLVGASTTVVGSKMYLFGGRLVTERRMVADLYVFDLQTYNWERIPPFPEDDVPRARYFHSVDTWNNQLIVFGGMSNQPDSPNPDELCVLNDVRFFDIATRHWLPPSRLPTPENMLPRARYAQLSSVTGDRLFIIGGQDFYNTWLDDVCVYDLLAKTWSEKRDYPRHCGSYRSVAVSSNHCVRFPKEEIRSSRASSSLGPPGTRFQQSDVPPSNDDFTPSESLTHLPYSAAPNDEHPSDIYLYSNYNFTDVKRELELFSPLPDTGFTIEDRSAAMSGTTFPPGLRFPTGAILGTHLIIAGIYLAHSYQSFSIWVLDLQTMVWSRIDPGKAVESGSWFRGCLWPEANKFMVFGNRNGNLVDDYNRRLLSWDHVAVVDLEAFGIYQPPPLKLDIPMQELGLAALEEQVLADFDIVCDDGRKIGCSRKLLEERWPWFKEQRLKLLQTAMVAMEKLPSSPMHIPAPELPGGVDDQRPDPRLTPRAFHLSEPYPITLALMQYFYTLALLTPLQTAPAVLSQLLVLATNYRITHLESLVKHAMHRALSNSTSVGVYEVATLCSCRSLQIRALKTVMSYTQKKPSRSKPDKDGGGGGRPSDGGSGPSNNTNGGGPSEPKYVSRPRGTSDARWATHASDTGTRGGYSNFS
ncbi:galactose oxidase [Mycena sp. CBHHK59/15]|nr:galactose oxidase [Mycena sp. CBHHK59/15]